MHINKHTVFPLIAPHGELFFDRPPAWVVVNRGWGVNGGWGFIRGNTVNVFLGAIQGTLIFFW
jgi:hypothetical protein